MPVLYRYSTSHVSVSSVIVNALAGYSSTARHLTKLTAYTPVLEEQKALVRFR